MEKGVVDRFPCFGGRNFFVDLNMYNCTYNAFDSLELRNDFNMVIEI